MAGPLAAKVRAKYPGVYDDLDDAALEAKILAKYPEYADLTKKAPDPSKLDQVVALAERGAQAGKNIAVGAGKGAARTATGLGRLTHMIPGVSPAVDALYGLFGGDTHSAEAFAQPGAAETELGLDPNGHAQKLGMFLEQMAEFMVPGALAEKTATAVATKAAPYVPKVLRGTAALGTRAAGQGAASAGVTAAQGGDVGTAATVGAALPVVGKVLKGTAQVIGDRAVPFARSAAKATVTEMKQQAGASMTGINKQADRLARFIIDNRLTNPDKAQAIIDTAERDLAQALRSAGNPIVNAPQRTARYLKALEASASKQGLPAADVAIIRGKAAELLADSRLAKDVTTTATKPTSVATRMGGGPATKTVKVKGRELRDDMRAEEALETARATSRWSTRKAYGEMKGAATEAEKAAERGSRDAVKAGVPAAKPILRRESQAILAKKVLDRKAFREANRDPLGLPAHVMAAGEIASGRPPIMAIATNLLRDKSLQLGIWADRLASAMKRNDVQEVTAIMGRLGVGATAQATKPAYGR